MTKKSASSATAAASESLWKLMLESSPKGQEVARFADAVEKDKWKPVIDEAGGTRFVVEFLNTVVHDSVSSDNKKGFAAKAIAAMATRVPNFINVVSEGKFFRNLGHLLEHGDDVDRENVAWAIGMLACHCENYARDVVKIDSNLSSRLVALFSNSRDDTKIKALWAARSIMENVDGFAKVMLDSEGQVVKLLANKILPNSRRNAVKSHAIYILGMLLSKYPAHAKGLDMNALIKSFCTCMKTSDENILGDVSSAIADMASAGIFSKNGLAKEIQETLAVELLGILKQKKSFAKAEAAFAIGELAADVNGFADLVCGSKEDREQLGTMLINMIDDEEILCGTYSILAIKNVSAKCETFRNGFVKGHHGLQLLTGRLVDALARSVESGHSYVVSAVGELSEIYPDLPVLLNRRDPNIKQKLRSQLGKGDNDEQIQLAVKCLKGKVGVAVTGDNGDENGEDDNGEEENGENDNGENDNGEEEDQEDGNDDVDNDKVDDSENGDDAVVVVDDEEEQVEKKHEKKEKKSKKQRDEENNDEEMVDDSRNNGDEEEKEEVMSPVKKSRQSKHKSEKDKNTNESSKRKSSAESSSSSAKKFRPSSNEGKTIKVQVIAEDDEEGSFIVLHNGIPYHLHKMIK